ncbi:MAG: M1 family aminopeptidase [Bacteroidales bacterium]
MIKSNLFVFLTIFFVINTKHACFAQFSYKENQATAIYSDTLEAVHYGIHLTDLNLTDKTIKGYTEAKLVSKINSLSSIKLELASLNVDSVFIENIRTNNISHSGNQINIGLVSPINTGDTINTRIYYHGQPFVDPSGWGGFHFSGDFALNLGVGFDAIPHNLGKAWFPCIDDFHDRALYDVYLTVANDKKAVSGGNLIEVTNQGNGFSTWHWKTDFTLPTYLISATTGKYSLVTDTYNGLQGQVPITYYCKQGDTAKVAGTFINMKNILQIFENHFGPYPFERVGYTGTPGGLGAMEHAANVSYPFSGWTGSTENEWWYAHELSHMWFGDKVTCASAEDMWLNEGWAVWCESLYREGLYGKQAYKDNMRSKLKDVLQNTYITDGGYFAVYGIPQTITYGSTVYQKGGQVTHTLRGYLGDGLFFGGVKAYLQQYGYNYASSYDLQDFLTTYSGIDMVPFFDAWVFAPGFPHFSIDSTVTVQRASGFDVTVYVRQKLKGTTQYANANHLEISFLDANWQSNTDTIVFSGITGSKTFHFPFSPIEVMADADEKISDATTDVSKTIKTTGDYEFEQTFSRVLVEQVADSALVRITHNWVAADSLVIPQSGLRVSDSRYWTVEGIFPQGFRAKGKFNYNRAASLDLTLITNSQDSLVILYRQGAGHQWQGTNFTRQGGWFAGTITVDTLKTGEYTLAIWDRQYLETKENKTDRIHILNIYPNPAKEQVNIEIESKKKIIFSIYDTLGKEIFKKGLNPGTSHFEWTNPNKASSVFIMNLIDTEGNLIESRKVVFN